MPVLSAALRARPHLEAPTRNFRWPDGQPVPALAGRHRMHWRFSNMLRGPAQISGDIFGEAFDDDAPAYAELWVPVVHFEGKPSLCDKVQLGTGSGAEHHDPALHRVIDRKDLRLALYVERNPTQFARFKQKFALMRRQRFERLIWCHASIHPYRMNREEIRSRCERPAQIGTFGNVAMPFGLTTLDVQRRDRRRAARFGLRWATAALKTSITSDSSLRTARGN